MIAKTITTQLAAVSLALLVIAGCASQRGRSPDPPVRHGDGRGRRVPLGLRGHPCGAQA